MSWRNRERIGRAAKVPGSPSPGLSLAGICTVAEDEAAFETSETVMNVPRDLVPKVRELIAKYQS
jgi:hypothetical protein